jgi:hypothetical protein
MFSLLLLMQLPPHVPVKRTSDLLLLLLLPHCLAKP